MYINGRGGQVGGPDPETQSWGALPMIQALAQEPLANLVLTVGANAESGIDLTVLRCTFYRNFAVSCHEIAAIWLAFFSIWQRYRR